MKVIRFGRLFALRAASLGAAAAFAMSAAGALTAFAMSAKISFNDPSAEPGAEVTVSMRVASEGGEALGSANIMLSYDSSILEFVSGDNAEGGAGSLHVSGQATTDAHEWYYGLRFKALREGVGSVGVTSAEIYDRDEKLAELAHQGSASVTVGGGAAAAQAGAAALSSLSMTPGELTPAFSPEIGEYTAVVGDEVTRIAVSAVPAAQDAKVNVSGNENLQLGENKITVSVTGADGAEIGSCTITVMKREGPTPSGSAAPAGRSVTVDGTAYEIAENFDETLLPAGFTAESYSYGGSQVLSGKGQDGNLRLMYLLAAGGSGDLFLYDSEADRWSPYVEVGMSARAVTALPLGKDAEVPADLVSSKLNLNGKTVEGWIGALDQGENFCVFYGMNADGQKNFYRFDLAEKTIQRYFTDARAEAEKISAAEEALRTLEEKYRHRGVWLFAAIAAALAAALAAVWLAFSGRRPESRGAESRRASGGAESGRENGASAGASGGTLSGAEEFEPVELEAEAPEEAAAAGGESAEESGASGGAVKTGASGGAKIGGEGEAGDGTGDETEDFEDIEL